MTTCGTVMKSLLLLAVVVALIGQGSAGEGRMGPTGTWVLRGRHENQDTDCHLTMSKLGKTNRLSVPPSADEKFYKCCTTVSREEITETIVDYMVQLRKKNCVNAIM
jgi:hypothetical protein